MTIENKYSDYDCYKKDEDLNRKHNLTLTEGQISTILYTSTVETSPMKKSKMHLVKPLGLVGYIFTTTLALLMLIPCLIVYGILLLAWVAGSLFSITYQYSYRVWMSLTREKP